MSYVVAAVDKALLLLEFLADNPGSGVTEIASQTGGTKSQAFRLLCTLEQRGFVSKDAETRNYRLGYRNLFLGDRTRHQNGLIRVARPVMDNLAEDSMENVHLVVREGLGSVVVALRESPQPLRLYAQVGRRGPLHAGGASSVLLAYAPSDVQDAVCREDLRVFTPATVTEPALLRDVLQRIREQGYAVSMEDVDEGAFSIAAPIRDHEGEVVAAMSVAGPVTRLTEALKQAHIVRVRGAAAIVSRGLGWRDAEVATAS